MSGQLNLNRRTPSPLKWVRIAPAEKHSFSLTALDGIAAPLTASLLAEATSGKKSLQKRVHEMSSLSHAITSIGLPSIPGATPDEELMELLRAAAEIEHGLMAQYLYGANSCNKPPIARICRQIAVEEMGHFVTVQNILLTCDQPPYLGRYDKTSSDFAPFPFHLEPLSSGTIAKYAACEMPDPSEVDAEELVDLPALLDDAEAAAGNVMPARVGLLYMKIYWLLRADDAPLADPALEPWPNYPVAAVASAFPGRHVGKFPVVDSLAWQGKDVDWQAGNQAVIVLTVTSRDEGLNAVAKISAQGEGFGGETDGHFDRFVKGWRLAKASGGISQPYPTDPWYREPADPEKGAQNAEITSLLAKQFAKLGDYCYEMLLLAIGLQLHGDSGYTDVKRSTMAGFCLDVMRVFMRSLVTALPKLTIRDEQDSPQLPLCFTLPEAPKDAPGLKARLAQVFDETETLATSLVNNAAVVGPPRNAAVAAQQFCVSQRPLVFDTK